MNKNYGFWKKEHDDPEMLPQISINRPSASVLKFLKFLKDNDLPIQDRKILSLGCGKGRNEIHLAEAGFNVVGIDYIDAAIEKAEERAKAILGDGWSEKVSFIKSDALEYLKSVDTGSYDYVADITFTTDVYDEETLREVGEEAHRILKRGGLLLFYGLHITDPISKLQIGGEENGLVYIKEYNKYEKLFDEGSVREIYSKLEMLASEVIEKERTFLDKRDKTRLLYAIFRK